MTTPRRRSTESSRLRAGSRASVSTSGTADAAATLLGATIEAALAERVTELRDRGICGPALIPRHYASLVRRSSSGFYPICLLYTSDAADERSSVDLGGRRII